MSEVVIRVDGLGKKYTLGREVVRGHAGYRTLREELMQLPRRLAARARSGADRTAALADEFWALSDVTFEVAQGEVVGIIGRNGAGKSTLLKILSRITEPTTGRIRVKGRVASLLEVGTGFHQELTGRENIYLNGAILGMSHAEIRAKFDEIIAFAEIEKFLETPVKRYSSGMYVRLAFAVAAHLEPEILIVDEVLAVGDAEFQKKCLGKMQDVSRSGRTVLFVSHQLNTVQKLCSRVLLLGQGQVIENSRDVEGAIRRYLGGGEDGSADAVSEWRNSGQEYPNPWFRPLRMYLGDEDGTPVNGPVGNDSRTFVHLEGEIGEYDTALTIGYALYAESGELLYWSYQTDGPETEWPKLRPGLLTLSSMLPQRILNEGTYRVELISSLHYRQWLVEPGVNAPSVTLHVQGGLSDSPIWNEKRPGLLAPVARWTCSFSERAEHHSQGARSHAEPLVT